MRASLIAIALLCGSAIAEPIIIRITMPDGSVDTQRITSPRVVSNAVARLDRDTAAGSTNSAAARQARREAREAARQAALKEAGGQ